MPKKLGKFGQEMHKNFYMSALYSAKYFFRSKYWAWRDINILYAKTSQV